MAVQAVFMVTVVTTEEAADMALVVVDSTEEAEATVVEVDMAVGTVNQPVTS
jgi:hypothetical protein